MKGTDVRWDVVGFSLGLSALLALMWKHRRFIHDDAFISLRYARNLAEHGVLEWNLGDRVEGYTNFLHVVMSAGLIRLGADPLLAARSVNMLGALALLLAVVFAARRLAPGYGPARLLATLATGATPAVAVWVLGGLEAVVVAAFLAWGAVGLIATLQGGTARAAALAGLAFSLAVLTRLDSAVFIAGAGLSILIFAPGALVRRLLLACCVAAVPAAVSLLHMAWRLDYYGLPFPLTFYAKTGVPLAFRLEFLPTLPGYILAGLPLLLPAALAALIGVAHGQNARLAAALALPALLQIAYVIWSGGDHMPATRVLVPLTGIAALLLLGYQRLAMIFAGAGAALTILIAVQQQPLKTDPAAFVGTVVGRFMDEWAPGLTIVVATAGSTPFRATDHTYIDQLGLNDPVIAMREDVPFVTPAQHWPGHAKGDGAYILSRQPDVIVLGPAQGTTPDQPWFLSDVELTASPDFVRCYVKREADIAHLPEEVDQNPGMAEPTRFTWYERTCPKD